MHYKTTFKLRRWHSSIILIICCFFSSFSSFAQQWDVLASEGDITSSGSSNISTYTYNSLIVIKNGSTLTPYVAYIDGYSVPKVKRQLANGIWESVNTGLPTYTNTTYTYTRLFKDNANALYLTYIDPNSTTNAGRLAVKKLDYNDSTWKTLDGTDATLYVSTGNANFNTLSNFNTASRCTIVFDSSNTPYITYNEVTSTTNNTYVKKYNGTAWVGVGTQPISSDIAITPDLTLDPGFNGTTNTTMWASYTNLAAAGDGSGSIAVLKYDGSSWSATATYSPTTTQTGAGTKFANLQWRDANNLYVVYNRASTVLAAQVITYNTSTSWASAPTVLGTSTMLYPNLIKDDSGNLYCSFRDALTVSNSKNVARVMFLGSAASSWAEYKEPVSTFGIDDQLIWPSIDVPTASTTPYLTYSKANSTTIITPVVRSYKALAPSISSFSPATPLAGSTAYTLTGTNFTGATAVTIGGATASFSVTDDTHISATSAASLSNSTVTITTPNGTGTTIVPTISYVIPTTFVAAASSTTWTPTVNTSLPITTWAIASPPTGVTISAVTGIITFGPTTTATASNTYTVTATHAYGTSTFPITFAIVANNTATTVNNWLGTTNTSWNTASNWSLGRVPIAGDCITINTQASNNYPVLDTDYTVTGTLVMSGSAASLTINPNQTLSIQGFANFGSRPITIKSNATGTGKIGVSTGNIIGAGGFVIERYIPARRAFRLLTSPVSTASSSYISTNWQETAAGAGFGTHITGASGTVGSTINGFDTTTTGNPSLFTHNNATQAWEAVTSNTNATRIFAGDPYRLMVRGDRTIDLSSNTPTPTNTTLRTTGTLVIGKKIIGNLSSTSNAYSFIGNPFPCPVDMQAVIAASTNLKQFYYVWDPTLGTRGAYVTRDLTNSTNNVTSNVDNYLQSGQACFVQTNTTAPTSLTFLETNKYTAASNTGVWKVAGSTKAATSKLSFTLYDKNAYTSKGTPADGAVVVFNNESSNEVDANDAGKMTNLDENLGIKSAGKLLSIENRMTPTERDVIELDITKYRSSDYTMVVEGSGLEDVTAYLVDKFSNTTTKIPASGKLTYDFTVDATNANSSAANRFQVTFSNQAAVASTDTFMMYPNPATGGETTITIADSSQKSKISLLNVSGQLIYSVIVEAGNSSYNFKPATKLARGLYLVKLEQNGKSEVKKLIVK